MMPRRPDMTSGGRRPHVGECSNSSPGSAAHVGPCAFTHIECESAFPAPTWSYQWPIVNLASLFVSASALILACANRVGYAGFVVCAWLLADVIARVLEGRTPWRHHAHICEHPDFRAEAVTPEAENCVLIANHSVLRKCEDAVVSRAAASLPQLCAESAPIAPVAIVFLILSISLCTSRNRPLAALAWGAMGGLIALYSWQKLAKQSILRRVVYRVVPGELHRLSCFFFQASVSVVDTIQLRDSKIVVDCRQIPAIKVLRSDGQISLNLTLSRFEDPCAFIMAVFCARNTPGPPATLVADRLLG